MILFFSWLALSVSHTLDSSPKGRASGEIENFARTAKASHFGGGGIAQAMTERARTLTIIIFSDIPAGSCQSVP